MGGHATLVTAYRLDPIRPYFIWLLGLAYFYAGREQEALEHWNKTEQLAPAYNSRGMTEYYLAKGGDLEKAREFHAKLEKLEPSSPRVTWLGGIIAALEGDRERALLAIRKIEDAKLGPISFNYIGFVYHALGDLDSYFEYMNKGLEAHTIIPSILMYSPLFAKARADPRYRAGGETQADGPKEIEVVVAHREMLFGVSWIGIRCVWCVWYLGAGIAI